MGSGGGDWIQYQWSTREPLAYLFRTLLTELTEPYCYKNNIYIQLIGKTKAEIKLCAIQASDRLMYINVGPLSAGITTIAVCLCEVIGSDLICLCRGSTRCQLKGKLSRAAVMWHLRDCNWPVHQTGNLFTRSSLWLLPRQLMR